MEHLNYHHLRYFREVAHAGNLTRAAETLNVAQSALSVQIRTLEDRFGHKLFDRVGRRLELTEVGRIALDYADRIFETGQELVTTLKGAGSVVPPLRVGAASTLSRNFQLQFLRPALRAAVPIALSSGPDAVLLDSLKAMALDVVLSTEPPRHAVGPGVIAHRLDAQTVGLHGVPDRLHHATLAELLAHEPFIIPTDPTIRAGFAALSAHHGLTPTIIAEVDDMAMVRLLAREGVGVAVAPAIVLRDELSSGLLETAPFALDFQESFFAITLRRSFPHPLLAGLLSA